MTPEEKQLEGNKFKLKKDAEKIKQDKYKDKNGKFEQKKEKDGFSVTEYVGPHGVGWELVSRVTKGNEEYMKIEGEGVEADERNHDWQLIKKDDYGNRY